MSFPTLRIVVAGDLGTGKSNLVNFYIRSLIVGDFDPTIEDKYYKQVTIDGKVYNIEIIDSVDNEFRNNSERCALYQECDAIILTFAIDDLITFNNLVIRYASLPINEEDGNKKLTYINGRIKLFPPIILVGTKCDLEMARQVSYSSGLKFSHDFQLQDYFECSSNSNINIDELFNRAIELGFNFNNSERDLTNIYAIIDDDSQLKKSQSSSSGVSSKQSKEGNNFLHLKNGEAFNSIIENESEADKTPSKASSKGNGSKIESSNSRTPTILPYPNNNSSSHIVNQKVKTVKKTNNEESTKKTVTAPAAVKTANKSTKQKPSETGSQNCCVIM